jgi:hypothetical protein
MVRVRGGPKGVEREGPVVASVTEEDLHAHVGLIADPGEVVHLGRRHDVVGDEHHADALNRGGKALGHLEGADAPLVGEDEVTLPVGRGEASEPREVAEGLVEERDQLVFEPVHPQGGSEFGGGRAHFGDEKLI